MIIDAILNSVNLNTRFDKFDKVTEFRLKNSVIVAMGLGILSPLIVVLKGIYLLPWIVALMSIVQTLTVKLNKLILKKFNIQDMYRIGIFIHLGFIINSSLYFINPLFTVYGDGILAIMEVAIFSSYSIALNNYITKFYPKSMSEFQITKNSAWADGYLIGLTAITVVTFCSTLEHGLLLFIAFNTIFSAWLVYNWNFFKNIDMDLEIK